MYVRLFFLNQLSIVDLLSVGALSLSVLTGD